VQRVELALPLAVLAPGRDLLAGLVELDDAVIGVPAMAVADKNVAIGRHHDAACAVEEASALPGMPGLPSVISTLPSGLNLTTTAPLPFRTPLSAAHTLPPLST